MDARERILSAIAAVPHGEIATYGGIAARAGLPRRARLVARVLAEAPEAAALPWHRIVAAGGRLAMPAGSAGHEEQVRRLRLEGHEVNGSRVRLPAPEACLDALLWAAPHAPAEEPPPPHAGPPYGKRHVVFSHGKESGPWGTKIRALANVALDAGFTVDSVDYQGIDAPAARVAKLVAAGRLAAGPLVLVGSSLGGHVCTAAAAALSVRGVFLMAPAFFMPGYESLTPAVPDCLVEIAHGWHDDIVPVDNSLRWARQAAVTLHLLDTEHRMTSVLPELERLFAAFLARLDG